MPPMDTFVLATRRSYPHLSHSSRAGPYESAVATSCLYVECLDSGGHTELRHNMDHKHRDGLYG